MWAAEVAEVAADDVRLTLAAVEGAASPRRV